jgi:hypothetical protein
MMRAGQLSPHDVARLHSATGSSDKAGIQRGLQSFVSPLSPQQLARHEQFHQKVIPHVERAYGVQLPEPQMNSSAYSRKGVIHASQPAFRAEDEPVFGPLPPSSYRATLEHEAAERRMQLAAAGGRYQKRPFGTHLGPAAIIAERLGFQNPDVHAHWDLTREENPIYADRGNSAMLKKLRRHGMVGNYVMPLGGRAHRSADFDRRQRRELQRAQEGKLRPRLEDGLSWARAQEQIRQKYLNTLTPEERDRGLWTTDDRTPDFDKDPVYLKEIERLSHEYFDNAREDARQRYLKKITEQKVTDPTSFLATQSA